jgi:hypothetical protein
MRGLREILAHPAKKPIGPPEDERNLPVAGQRPQFQTTTSHLAPGNFWLSRRNLKKPEVLQHPLASLVSVPEIAEHFALQDSSQNIVLRLLEEAGTG